MASSGDKLNGDTKRIRFQKPIWAIDTASEDPYGCIAEVFTWIHLDDFREELQEWLRIALINDESAYDTGYAREDVMDFCEELQVLMEALQVLNMNRPPDDRRRWIEGLPGDLREEIKRYNRPVLLSAEQKAEPQLIIKSFCNTFSLSYAGVSFGICWIR